MTARRSASTACAGAGVGDRGAWFLTASTDPDFPAYALVNAQGRYLFGRDDVRGGDRTDVARPVRRPHGSHAVAGRRPRRRNVDLPIAPETCETPFMAEMHDATEEYLETILEIEEEGITPIRARLVERLGLSAAGGLGAGNRLVEQGYAELARRPQPPAHRQGPRPRDHRSCAGTGSPSGCSSTSSGSSGRRSTARPTAGSTRSRPTSRRSSSQLLGDPATCPHGNPIPGSHNRPDSAPTTTLTNALPGLATVSRISEKLELDDDALVWVAHASLVPGAAVSVVGRDGDVVVLESDAGEQRVPHELADLLFVRAGRPLARPPNETGQRRACAPPPRRGLVVLAVAAIVAARGCGGGGSGTDAGSSGNPDAALTRTTLGDPSSPPQARCRPIGNIRTADATVRVLLKEFTVKPSKAKATAGDIGFTADNQGKQPHELLILRDVAIDAIPADEAGGIDEAKLPHGSIVGRIGPFPAKTTCDGVFALSPGTYLLLDDITVLKLNGTVVSNAANGMVAQFTVV